MKKIDISVIICCYNSENRIVATLEHLSKQSLRILQCEIILVDNNCTDSTTDLAKQAWESFGNPFQLKIIKESKPGLSYARMCGVFAAKGEIIVFCDDDNWLNENYLSIAFETMKINSRIGVLAGQSNAISDTVIPNWFYTYYGAYACGVLGLNSGNVTNRLWVWGAGMVLRTKIIIDLYSKFNHLSSDRKGSSLDSGGDVEICLWHVISGYQLWYEENLYLDHYMPSDRLCKNYADNLFKAQLQSSLKIESLSFYASEYLYFKEISIYKVVVKYLVKFNLIDLVSFSRRYIKYRSSKI